MAEQPALSQLPASDDRVDEQARQGDARLVRRVRWRLVLFSGGTTLLILLALGALLYVRVASSLETTGVAQLDARAASLKQFLGGSDNPGNGPPTGLIFGGGSSGTFAVLITADGQRIGDLDDGVPTGLPNVGSVAAAWQTGRDVRDTVLADVPVRILSVTASSRIGPVVIQVVQDRTDEQKTLDVISDVLIFGGLLAVAVAGGFGALYARRALAPIRSSLANQRLALRRQREFAADASHELRTPLAVVRGSVEHLLRHPASTISDQRETLEDLKAETDHLTELVDALLLLARADSGAIELERQPLDLADVTTTALEPLTGIAASHGVTLHLDARPTPALGDALRVRQLVTILVDNAIQHSPPGGTVSVRTEPAGDKAIVSVADEGSGIRPEDLPRVFERFWRAPDAPSGGAGLGLSIARWIVERHDGTIEATSPPGGGARFEVTLPTH